MKKIFSLVALCLCLAGQASAEKIQVSTTDPGSGTPEHLYSMKNSNGQYANGTTAPTFNPANYGQFAFYESGTANAYFIYSYTAEKWLTYTKASSYSNKISFVTLTDTKPTTAYFKFNNYSGDLYEISPVTSSGSTDKYLNWYQGLGSNPADGTTTLGLWQQGGSQDAGSGWTFSQTGEISIPFTSDNGSWTATNATGTWAASWQSTQSDPFVTVSTSMNNMMNYDGTSNIQLFSGASGFDYTITAQSGYVVTGYSFDFTNSDASVNMKVTPSGGTAVTCSGSSTAHVSVTGLEEQSTSFNVIHLSSEKKFVNTSNFIITVKKSTAPVEEQTNIFITQPGQLPYRIPSITTAKNGDILAVGDYRYCGADIGFGRVDIHGRISKDNGQTWGTEFKIAQGSGTSGAVDCGFGDAATVTDSETGKMMLISVCGNTVYGASTTTRSNPNRVARFYSEDNGATWSAYQEITEDIYSLFDASTLGAVQSLFFGSGRICQSRQIKVGSHYRIYAALCARPNGNRVIYSDDFGQTWHSLGSINISPAPSGDEPKCEELPDGSVVLSSRTNGGRYFNIFTYTDKATAAGSWGTVAFSGSSNSGTVAQSNATNGEILILPARRNSDNKKLYVALQSVPYGPGRTNVCIYYKELTTPADFASPAAFARDWNGRHQASQMGSAYSTMILQNDNTIGFFYEESTFGADYTLVYKNYTLENITDDAYTYDPTVTYPDYVGTSVREQVDQFFENSNGYVGSPDLSKKPAIDDMVTAYEANPTEEAYQEILTALNAAVVTLQEGKWYRLENTARPSYKMLVPAQRVRDNVTYAAFTGTDLNEKTADQLWQFKKSGDNWLIYNGNYNCYISESKAMYLYAEQTDEAGAGAYDITSQSTGISLLRSVNPTNSSIPYLHMAGEGNLVAWTAAEPASQWYIEPVSDIKADVPEGGYATVCYPFAVSIPESVQVYAAKTVNEATGDMAYLYANGGFAEGTLKAGTPAVIKAEAGTQTFAIASDIEGTADDNALTGVLAAASYAEGTNYVINAAGTAFVKAAATGTAAANTAYLPAALDVEELPFTFTYTGIRNLNIQDGGNAAPVYDLSGRRVQKAEKGIYITSGKKQLVK